MSGCVCMGVPGTYIYHFVTGSNSLLELIDFAYYSVVIHRFFPYSVYFLFLAACAPLFAFCLFSEPFFTLIKITVSVPCLPCILRPSQMSFFQRKSSLER